MASASATPSGLNEVELVRVYRVNAVEAFPAPTLPGR
jgi:hypothetical protein